jgi:K(+)-stimulated pyrophosphate-energized sodium pump
MIYCQSPFIGLAFMFTKRAWVLKQDPGDGKMKEISDYIYEGALAFLKAEYRLLTFFVVVQYCFGRISFIVPTTHILIVVPLFLEHFSLLWLEIWE